MKRKKKVPLPTWLAIVIGIAVGFVIALALSVKITLYVEKEVEPLVEKPIEEKLPISQEGFTKVSLGIRPGMISLRDDCQELTMKTSLEQTKSIERGLAQERGFRPNAHDLFAETVTHYNITVLFARIESISGGTFFAKLYLKKDNRVLTLDSRPSDAIAIVVRTKADIYVKDSLLADYGERVC